MIYLIYFVVIILANTIGAISGMGGGVIIKPSLDALGYHPLALINFFSSAAVFTMSIVSIYKQVKGGFSLKWQNGLAIALASIIGGNLGDRTFNLLMAQLDNQDQVQLIQIVITVIALGLSIWYTWRDRPALGRRDIPSFFLASLVLGFLSTLLGIGGGPMNVALFIWVFGITTKQATIYSIITIFFSQLSKLTAIVLGSGIPTGALTFLAVIIPAAILGGYIGSSLNQKFSEQRVRQIYQVVTAGVILLNLINAIGIII